jgi:hypothetical protein
LVLLIVFLVAAISGLMALTGARSYEAEARFITRQAPTGDQAAQYFTFDRYYNWFSSEFLVDDYTEVVESDAFAAATLNVLRDSVAHNVLARPDYGSLTSEAQEQARTVINKLTPEHIKGMIQTDRKHRILRLMVTASPKVVAKAISDASATVLADSRMEPVQGQTVDDRAVFSQIDLATMEEIQSSTGREIIAAIIRVLIGIVAALALAFLLEYLDNSVRDERDAKRVLDMPVLGTIPKS